MALVADPITNRDVRRVMILDEFDETSPLVDRLSSEDGFALARARSTPELMQALGVARPNLLLLDVGLVDRTTSKLIEFLGTAYPEIPIVVVAEDRQAALLAVKAGARFAVRKPVQYEDLRRALETRTEAKHGVSVATLEAGL